MVAKRDGKDGRRRLARARARERRKAGMSEGRGIAEGEKLRFTDRRTVTKREWSLRERGKLAEENEVGASGDPLRFPFSI